MSINRVTLVGVLGADPEVKDINGKRMASLRLATSEKWKDNAGAWQERTDWHTVVVWNDYFAGMLADQARKGARVMVEGKLTTRKWTKDGQDRYSTEVIVQGPAHQVVIGVAAARQDDQPHGGRSSERAARGGQQRQAPPAADLDDDLPW